MPNEPRVAYLDTAGHMHELRYAGGWIHADLSAITHATPAATGTALVGYKIGGGDPRYYFLDAGGHIQEISWWANAWHSHDTGERAITLRKDWGANFLNGWVEVTIRESGLVRFRGHAHDSGLEGYHFRVASLVKSNEEGWRLGPDRLAMGGGRRAEVVISKGDWLGVLRWRGNRLVCDDWMGHNWVNGGVGAPADSGWRLGSDPVAVGDIDGDGKAEVVISKGDWLGVLRWRGNRLVCDDWMGHNWVNGGVGAPADSGWRLGSDPVAVGDIDGDGKAEVVISKGDWLGVLRWRGNRLVCDDWMGHNWVNGGVGAPADSGWRLGSDPVAVGDIDGDGKAEVVISKGDWLGVLRWRGNRLVCDDWMGHNWVNGGVGAPADSGWRLGSDPVAVGDIDGDGKAEVVISKGDWLGVLRWRGNRLVCDDWMGHNWVNGGVGAPADSGWRLGSDPVAVGDIDGDGKAEVVISKGDWLGVLRWRGNRLVCDDWMGHNWVNHEGNDASFAIGNVHSGWVDGGTTSLHPKRNDDWDLTITSPSVKRRFAQLLGPSLETEESHVGTITTQLRPIIDMLGGLAVGAALGPTGGLLLVVVGEGISLATTGSAIPGAQLLNGVLWMTGPLGELYAIVPEAIATLGTQRRVLTDAEWALASAIFGDTLPPRHLVLITDAIGKDERAFTWPSSGGREILLNLGNTGFKDALQMSVGNLSAHRPAQSHAIIPGEILVHELTHAWQYHNGSLDRSYFANAMAAVIAGGDSYNYSLDGRDFKDYGLEQQAQIVSDWFGLTVKVTSHGGALEISDDNDEAVDDPAYQYVVMNIRTGHGAYS